MMYDVILGDRAVSKAAVRPASAFSGKAVTWRRGGGPGEEEEKKISLWKKAP